VPFGPTKVEISRVQPPPTCPNNGSARILKHYVQGCINRRDIGGFMYKGPHERGEGVDSQLTADITIVSVSLSLRTHLLPSPQIINSAYGKEDWEQSTPL
jgi:hypothetical protein